MSALVKKDILEHCTWSKMTILSKILDRAKIFGIIKIFILDMSAVVKNDNFEQNPALGQHF